MTTKKSFRNPGESDRCPALQQLRDRLPVVEQVPRPSAAVAAAITGLGVFIEERTTGQAAERASEEAGKVAGKTFVSTYAANGIMRNLGGKALFTTVIDTARMDSKQLSALTMKLSEEERYLFAGHMAGTAFIATLIFDESGTLLSLINSEASADEFMFETGKNIFTAGAVGGVTWATVFLGASPGGLVVAAMAISTHVIVGTTFEAIELYRQRQHLAMKDFVGRLPPAIQTRLTPFDSERLSAWDPPRSTDVLFPDRTSVFEITPQKRPVFEP